MTPQDLIEAGYTKSTSTKMKDETGKYCKAHYFRWIEHPLHGIVKKLYQISVWEWDLPGIGTRLCAETKLYQNEEDHAGFNVELHDVEKMSRGDMEFFFVCIFSRMECVPDVHNQD